MKDVFSVLKFSLLLVSLATTSFAGATSSPPNNYQKLNSDCRVCKKLNALLVKFSETSAGNIKINIIVEIGSAIKPLWMVKSRPPAIYTDIHYSLNASLEVLNYDFDSETVAQLLKVRQKYPTEFDYVFWRFPRGSQERILERMKVLVQQKILPKAKLPEIKEEA